MSSSSSSAPAAAPPASARHLPWVVASGGLNALFATLTFGSSVFVLYLNGLGMPKTAIGFMLSLFPFCGVVAPLIIGRVQRFGLKRTFLWFYGTRKFVMALLALAPWVLIRFGPQAMFAYAAAVTMLFALCRAVAETAYYPWAREFVPDAVRGRFMAIANVVALLCAALGILAASFVIRRGTGPERFLPVLLGACVFGFVSVLFMLPVPGGAPAAAAATDNGRHWHDMRAALADRNLRRSLAGMSLCTLSLASLTFLPLFIRERVGLPDDRIVLLDSVSMLGGLAASWLWGWAADRYGGKPVTLVAILCQGAVPLAWLAVPGLRLPFTVPVLLALLAGVFTAGNTIASLRWFLNHVVRPERSTAYTSVWYAWSGIVGGCAPLAAGRALDALKGANLRLGGLALEPFATLYAACGLCMVASTLVYRGVTSETPHRTRDFLRGILLHDLPRIVETTAFGLLAWCGLRTPQPPGGKEQP